MFISGRAYDDFGDIRFVKEDIPQLYVPGQLRTAKEVQECPLVDPDFGATFSINEAVEEGKATAARKEEEFQAQHDKQG